MDRQRTVLSKTSKYSLSIVAVLIFLALFGFFSSPFSSSSPSRSSFSGSKMGIVHIVMFEFKEEATADEIADVSYS
jgi:VIT1/CCC1 family predicted Fe2+/Mn2+ transporter